MAAPRGVRMTVAGMDTTAPRHRTIPTQPNLPGIDPPPAHPPNPHPLHWQERMFGSGVGMPGGICSSPHLDGGVKVATENGRVPFGDAVDAYTPTRIDTAVWETIGPRIRAVLHRLDADIRCDVVRDNISSLSNYAAYAYTNRWWDPTSRHAPPMSPEHVDVYIDANEGRWSNKSAGKIRAELRRLGRMLDHKAWPDVPAAYGESNITPPYSARETELLWAHAAAIASVKGHMFYLAMIAVGVGAGLEANDFRYVTGRHIRADANGDVWVAIEGPNARRIPVRHDWADTALAAGTALGNQMLVGGTDPNRTNPYARRAARFNADSPVRLSSDRARHTWMLTLLNDQVAVHEIAYAAGIRHLHTIERLLAYATITPSDGMWQRLRGPR